MGEVASKGQLRWSFARWAAVTVPAMLLLGFLSGRSVPSGHDNAWYVALVKPPLNPPDWAFPVAWTIIYGAMGVALAIVLNARGARGRGLAVALYVMLSALLFAWAPTFFGAHEIGMATVLIVGIEIVGIAVTLLFNRVRPRAAWLMVPLLVWVGFASVICWRLNELNPNAARVAPGGHTTQML